MRTKSAVQFDDTNIPTSVLNYKMRELLFLLSNSLAKQLRDFEPGCKDVQAAQYCAIDCDDQFHVCVARGC